MIVLNLSPLNREYILIKVLKALASIFYIYFLHVTTFIKDYIQILNIRNERVLSSVQCEIIKIYGWSFLLIEFYIPVSTSLLHFIETALHLSANMFAVCRVRIGVISKEG
jgi:hypothetical protein